MTLDAITKDQLAASLCLMDAHGEINERAVADSLRAALSRWGLSPKRAVLRHARDQLWAAGVEVTCVPYILERLVVLGECDEVYVGHEIYVAPAEPRWMPLSDEMGSYLGVSHPPEGVSRVPAASNRDIVQRIRLRSDDDAAQLHYAGVREVSIAEWFSPIGYLRHATRRLRRPARSDIVTLAGFWDLLNAELAREGLPVGVDADVRVLTGAPGRFFGRHAASEPEGRWSAEAPDGVWCAFRRGYGEGHWHPTIISVDGEMRCAMDLYDLDEWQWAVLARGRRLGPDEVVDTSRGNVRLTFPPPNQLRAAMDLAGVPTESWAWDIQLGAADLWALVQ